MAASGDFFLHLPLVMAQLPNQLHPHLLEAGCDEAGRGCLAGPVVAAAVILGPDFDLPELNDSKQLSHARRMKLKSQIEEHALAWAVGICSPAEIDEINILNASILAMHKALEKLKTIPEHIAIDGNRFKKYQGIAHTTVIKGDGKYANIAAASILAKTHRDLIMENLHNDYPVYGWKTNMGYPTPSHRKAIREFGATMHHRKSFKLLEDQLSLF